MFIVAQFIIARTWKQPKYLLTEQWIKMWYKYTVKYCVCLYSCCLGLYETLGSEILCCASVILKTSEAFSLQMSFLSQLLSLLLSGQQTHVMIPQLLDALLVSPHSSFSFCVSFEWSLVTCLHVKVFLGRVLGRVQSSDKLSEKLFVSYVTFCYSEHFSYIFS